MAVYLIRDGSWIGENITIYGLEKHGANDGGKISDYEDEYGNELLTNNQGYLSKGGRMLNEEIFENLWDILKSTPSIENPKKNVTQEILEFDHHHPTLDVGRLIDELGTRTKPNKNNYKHMQFNNKDRALLTKLLLMPEKNERTLNNISIKEWFKNSPHLFETNFWYMWQTTFAFKESSSVMELRRYMNRMILEFSRIHTLEGVTRTPFIQYESIISPVREYLKDKGVKFVNNIKVTDWEFKDTTPKDDIIVTGLHFENILSHEKGIISVSEDDLVFDTNGSITDSSIIGDFTTPIKENMEYAPSAMLCKKQQIVFIR